MGLYRYEAVDKTGKVVHGAMNASDEQSVSANLSGMGYSVRAIFAAGSAPAKQQSAPPVSAAAAAPRPRGGMASVTVSSGVPVSVKSSVPLPQLSRFFRHMATLVRSGIPINQALNDMVPVTRHGQLRGILSRMRESTQGGGRLSGLMAEYPKVFPVHTTASVWAGELSGRLEVALDEIATDMEQETRDTRFGRIGWAMMKLNWIGLIILWPLCDFVKLMAPALKATLDKGESATRTDTLQALWQSYKTQMLWPTLLTCLGFCVSWIVWGYIKRIPQVRYILDTLLMNMPFWGRYHKIKARARFLHVMDGLMSAGLSIDAAWDAASLTVKNSWAANRLRTARQRLGVSASVSQLLAASDLFDDQDVGMLTSGEKAGTVPEVLAHLSQDQELQLESMRIKGRSLSTTTMIVLAIVIGIVLMFMASASYVELSFKAAEMMGQ